MSKRRISKQQRNRIQKIQASYRIDPEHSESEGLVLTRYGRHAEIETLQGELVHCAIRPNIDSLTAGDKVIWQAVSRDQGIVVSRFPRQTELSRIDKHGINRPMAANISQLMIVTAIKPEISWSLLDSYLVMAEHMQVNVCIIINKIDLPESEAITEKLTSIYKPLGYSILLLSKKLDLGYGKLEKKLQQQTSVFIGQSGVGKSSIIKQILPHETIQTAEISANSELGCHTTSNSRLYHLPHGGNLIDSPGVREFSLGKMSVHHILQGFRELKPLGSQCKFRNCNHLDSPGCAILASLHNKQISVQRYESFIKISQKRK